MIETNKPWRDRLVSAPVFFQAQQFGEVTGRRHAHSAFERESEILVVCSISNGAGEHLYGNSIEPAVPARQCNASLRIAAGV